MNYFYKKMQIFLTFLKNYKIVLTAAMLFVVLHILPLGVRPLIMPDESRYAEIPREMLESGDWIVPRLNGVRYFEKPVLGYWVTALSIMVFGENTFAIRFPSALAVGITALLVFWLGQEFMPGVPSEIFASVLLFFPLCFFIGVFNVLDSMLSMLVTASLVAFFFAYMAKRPVSKVIFLALCGGFGALAFLVKGFVALVIPISAILPFLFWERRPAFIKNFWVVLTGVVLVSLPWCILIYLRESEFWNYFFWHEHIRRFLHASPGQHAQPFWF